MVSKIAKKISSKHRFYISSRYWGRISSMENRYGEDIVLKCLDEDYEVKNLTHLLNIVEVKCQMAASKDTSNFEDIFKNA